MTDRRRINALMSALIDGTFGCLDGAAETINARWGRGVCKGTLSKKLSLQLDWTLSDIVALEDAAGRYPVTRMLARRMNDASRSAPSSMLEQAGMISREAGEAVSAILSAEMSAQADSRAEALREVDEAIEALRQAREILESRT